MVGKVNVTLLGCTEISSYENPAGVSHPFTSYERIKLPIELNCTVSKCSSSCELLYGKKPLDSIALLTISTNMPDIRNLQRHSRFRLHLFLFDGSGVFPSSCR